MGRKKDQGMLMIGEDGHQDEKTMDVSQINDWENCLKGVWAQKGWIVGGKNCHLEGQFG